MDKSNIDIISNVYIRDPKSLRATPDLLQYDSNFVANVSGVKALKHLRDHYGSLVSGVRLSQAQEDELNANIKSKFCGKGEQPYGLVFKNGAFRWECRCEPQAECPYYHEKGCNPHKIIREQRKTREEEGDSGKNLFILEYLGITAKMDIFSDSVVSEREREESVPAEEAIEIAEIVAGQFGYEKITAEQAKEKIIQSSLTSHIVVNAAPGTGKTYTAIQRLLYVLRHTEPEDYDRILVLCYTRVAVGEIRKRLEQGIAEGSIPFEAKRISICTFDSLATNYLVYMVEMPVSDLMKLDYNGRIRFFNEQFNKEDCEGYAYCIIDELQDLVNDRAIMALNIISALNCGYLLLGDKCQAIYDYDCTGAKSIKSTDFYKMLREILPLDTCRYELIGNKRQAEDLARRTEALREALLNTCPQTIAKTFRDEVSQIPIAGITAEKYNSSLNKGTTAILCRTNGQAEYVSWLLHKNKVDHTLLRTTGQISSLHRFIADVFWDYREKQISRSQFVQRLTVRRRVPSDRADICFDVLCDVSGRDGGDFLDCRELAKTLCHANDFPAELLNVQNENLIVSTIHKAKGREFDKVYLLEHSYMSQPKTSESDTEEERVFYVAETRPKRELEMLRKGNKYEWFFKKSDSGRWIKTVKLKCNPYKTYGGGFAVGHAEDIDFSSFVEGSIEQAVERQAYIAEQVRLEDEVSLKLIEENYAILHKGTMIGKTSAEMSRQLKEKFGGRQYIYSLPVAIRQLYVTNIITFVSRKDYADIPQWFRENRFWLGVEISGFGKMEWGDDSK